MTFVLDVADLIAGYTSSVDIIKGVNLRVSKGEIVTVIGPNGAGKSTFMKAVCGLLKTRGGHVTLDGDDITGVKPHLLNRYHVGYVPQLDNVFVSLSVDENLRLGAVGHNKREVRARQSDVLDAFPQLRQLRNRRAGLLSGGERQLVAMARALMCQPKLLLLDEPSAGLSPAAASTIFQKITEFAQQGVATVMVEQNARQALSIADRGYVLDLGTNRYEGTGAELMKDPKVLELYLGAMSASTASHRRRHGSANEAHEPATASEMPRNEPPTSHVESQ